MAAAKKLGVVLCGLIGMVIGGAMGWHFGTNSMLGPWVQEQARDVNGHLEILRYLKAGNTVDAVESLESRLDDDLITLRPNRNSRLKPHISEEIDKALRAAKQYRMEYPRKSGRTSIDAMVDNVLSEIDL